MSPFSLLTMKHRLLLYLPFKLTIILKTNSISTLSNHILARYTKAAVIAIDIVVNLEVISDGFRMKHQMIIKMGKSLLIIFIQLITS